MGRADVLTEKQEQNKNLSIELDSSISNVDHVEMPNDLPFRHPTDNDSGSFHNVSNFTVGEQHVLTTITSGSFSKQNPQRQHLQLSPQFHCKCRCKQLLYDLMMCTSTSLD